MSAETHLACSRIGSLSAGWSLIHKGEPIAENQSFIECLAHAARRNLHVAAFVWLPAKNRFASMAEAKAQPVSHRHVA